MDAAIFVSLAGGLAVVDVLVPFNARQFDVVVTAKARDGAAKRYRTVSPKKVGKIPVDFSTESYRGNYHSHGCEVTSGGNGGILLAPLRSGQFAIILAQKSLINAHIFA
jgi:hypothetical protein